MIIFEGYEECNKVKNSRCSRNIEVLFFYRCKCEIRSYSNPFELVFIPEFKTSSLKTAYIMINLVFVFDTFL